MSLEQNPLGKRQTVRARWKRRPGLVWFSLIPKRYARHQVVTFNETVKFPIRKDLRAFMFDFDSQRFSEHHRVRNVKPVSGSPVAGLEAFPQWRPVERTRLFTKPPTVAEIIFRAGPS